MNITSSPLAQVDTTTNKRQVLAKVYRLLLSLSQEAESNSAISDVTGTNDVKIIATPSVKEASPGQ